MFLSLIYLVSCYADLQKYYINVKLSDIYFCIYLHMIRTCSSGLSGHHLKLSPVNLTSFLVIFFFDCLYFLPTLVLPLLFLCTSTRHSLLSLSNSFVERI